MSHDIEEHCPACGDKDSRKFIQKCKLCETSFYVTEQITSLQARNAKLEKVLTKASIFVAPSTQVLQVTALCAFEDLKEAIKEYSKKDYSTNNP